MSLLMLDAMEIARTGVASGMWRAMRPRPTARLLLDLVQGRRDFFVAVAKYARERPQVVAAQDEVRALTWAELQEQSERVAGGLAALGVQRRQRVALVQENRVEHFVAMAAVLSLGAVPAPLAPHMGHEALVELLERGRFAAVIAEATCHVPGITMTEGWATLLRSPRRPAPLFQDRRSKGQPDLVLTTSGTTGGAQGARIDMHKARMGTAFRYLHAFDLHRGDRLFTACPVYHAAPMLLTGLAMLVGAEVIVARSFDPEQLVRDVERLGITHVFAVPTLLGRLARATTLPALQGSTLRALISGGAALRPDLKRQILEGVGPVLYDFYGATELGVVSVASPRDLQRCPAGVGRVLPGVQVQLRDETGRPVAAGQRGQLFARSDATSTFEGEEPAVEDWVSAGDIACFQGDQLCIVGRVKDVIITGGVNVFPTEVEQVLARHPAVADVCVAGAPDPEWGEAVVAFVVPRGDADVDDIRAFARRHLSPAQVPKRVILREALPVGVTGKVLRRSLLAGSPEG